MQYTIILAALASLAAAQTSSAVPTGGSCDAQTTLNVCKASIQGQIDSCASDDYSCLCTQYVNLLTCYNNCPNDLSVSSVQQQRDLYCNNASVYGSTTTYGTAAATATRADTTATGSGSEGTAVQTGFASGTGIDSSSENGSSDNGAASLEIGSGLIAIAAAGLGMML